MRQARVLTMITAAAAAAAAAAAVAMVTAVYLSRYLTVEHFRYATKTPSAHTQSYVVNI
jgi:hypothetical protein